MANVMVQSTPLIELPPCPSTFDAGVDGGNGAQLAWFRAGGDAGACGGADGRTIFGVVTTAGGRGRAPWRKPAALVGRCWPRRRHPTRNEWDDGCGRQRHDHLDVAVADQHEYRTCTPKDCAVLLSLTLDGAVAHSSVMPARAADVARARRRGPGR